VTCLRVVTESGSVYELDTEEKTLIRTPGRDAVFAAFDGEGFRYDYILDNLIQIGCTLQVVWTNPEGNPKLRVTTPVVSIEEIPSE
jgi:hypothetical protein